MTVPVVRLPAIARKLFYVTATVTLADGTVEPPEQFDYALLPANTSPRAATEWAPPPYEDGTAVLLAGPDADPAGADTVTSRGMDLWVRVVDTAEVDTARVAQIRVD